MDQYYIEEGYVEAAYFERIVDSGTIGFLPYFDENYAETGYVDQHGAEFILVADVGIVVGVTVTIESTTFEGFAALAADVGKIMQLQAAFTGVFTPSMNVNAVKNHFAFLDVVTDFAATASKQTDTGGLLEFIADLNAQSARFRDVDINIDVEFYTSDSSADIGTNIDANATFDAASILTSAFTISVDFDIVQIAQADIVATSIIEANAIEYQSRYYNSKRPIGWTGWTTRSLSSQAPYINPNAYTFESNALKVLSITSESSYVQSDTYISTNIPNPESWVLEFQFKANDDDPDNNTFFNLGTGAFLTNTNNISSGTTDVLLQTFNGNRLFLTISTLSATNTKSQETLTASISQTFTINTWNKVSIVYDKALNQYRLYLNNALLVSRSLGSYKTFQFYTGHRLHLIEDSFSGFDRYYDTLIFRYNTTELTSFYSAYTGGFEDLVYAKFDGNFDDSIGAVIDDNTVSTNIVFAQTASLTSTFGATANLNSAFTITADPGTLKEAESDFESVATQLTAGGKVGDFFINADIAFDFAIQDQLFKGFESDLENSITQTTVAVKTVDAVIAISSAFTPEISTDGFRAGAADLETVSSLDVTVTRIQQGVANLQIISTLDIEFTNVKLAEADLQTISSVDSTVTRIQQGASNFEAVATELAIINMIGNTLISATSAFELSASITGTVRSNADLESVFGVETVAVKTVDPTVNIEVISTAIIDTTYFAQTSVNLETAFTVVANAKELILDQYVYRIPRENRTINIYSENRTSTIRTETRTYIVEEN
jgi:hypothetical protein